MNQCEAGRPAPLRCPTKAEILDAIFALLPRGRAWQSNEGGPRSGYASAFQSDAFQEDAFAMKSRAPSILNRFWTAIASVLEYVNGRLCDLRLEFWCATHKETHDLWMAEYGLPDACDPFPDLCTKVAAIGGTRCEYYSEVAARAGWTISCEVARSGCGGRAGCSKAGRSRPGNRLAAAIVIIRVFTGLSPAYVGGRRAPAKAGRMKAGRGLSCGPDINPLRCILDRVVHAEILTHYEVVTS
jgi:hypothetical protein